MSPDPLPPLTTMTPTPSTPLATATPPAPPPLVVDRIALALGGRPVLRGLSARFERGWTALVGPNGAGKSTLLRVAAGLAAPDRGEVRLERRGDAAGGRGPGMPSALHRWPARERARHIAWLAQGGDVSGDLSVDETVALGRLAQHGVFGHPTADDAVAVAQAMAEADCVSLRGRRLPTLSGGERQRVLLARALATGAPVLLFDEPTTHLDAPHQRALAALFRRLAASRVLVTVLHDLPIALRADRVVVMAEGRLAAEGPPDAPAVQQALSEVFGGALQFSRGPDGRVQVGLDLA